ncbi:hypothetical protein ACIRG4_06900 [Streptomyces sp. NPDC102395]|uniref:hypothetical protein n=1 Tax=Streptomyces sp. NPDC102395 TaxID=3366168 RepID=UPI003814FCD3
MKAQRVRRLLAASAVGVLMAGGATVAAAGTASAAAPAHPSLLANHDWCDPHRWWNDCDFHDNFNDGAVVVIVLV